MRSHPTSHRRALITGATSGIGNAFAHALPATTGLLLTGRNSAALAQLGQDFAQPDRVIETLQADLATEAGCAAVTEAAERFGIDLFVCNAGQGPYGAFLATDPAFLRETVAVNVTAVLTLLRSLVPGMLARARTNGGRAGLIVTASEVGFFPVPNLATYAATKAFDLSLTEALAAELSREPIDVLALCPTATRTRFGERSGFGQNFPGAQDPSMVARAALRALGRQRTLTVGSLSGPILAGPALVRAGIAQAAALVQGFRR